jgi:hypothetical protein
MVIGIKRLRSACQYGTSYAVGAETMLAVATEWPLDHVFSTHELTASQDQDGAFNLVDRFIAFQHSSRNRWRLQRPAIIASPVCCCIDFASPEMATHLSSTKVNSHFVYK